MLLNCWRQIRFFFSLSAETDYRPLSDYEVTFAPDEYEKTVDIAIVGDSVLESEESFIVQLTLPLNPSQVGVDTAERNTTRVIITDDDCKLLFFLSSDTLTYVSACYTSFFGSCDHKLSTS